MWCFFEAQNYEKLLTLLLYIKNNFYSLCLFNLNMNGKIFEIDI